MTKINIAKITITEERRATDPIKVSELAESIKIIGLINPITIDKAGTLIAGAHRLEACRQLGFDEIECVVLDCGELLMELAEIDENLIRNNHDGIRIGELALRRDEVLEKLGLRRMHGGDGSNQHKSKGAPGAPLQTTESIAKESGISKRTLQENKQLAGKLVPEAKKAVREKAIPKKDALEISRLNPEQQREIVTKKDKKAIIAGVREKKQQKSQNGVASSRRKTVAKEPEPERDEEADGIAELERRIAVSYEISVGRKPEKFIRIPLPHCYGMEAKIFCACYGDASEELQRRVAEETDKLADAIYDLTHPE